MQKIASIIQVALVEGGTPTYNIFKNLLNGVGSREVFTLNSQLTRKNIIWDWSGNLYT